MNLLEKIERSIVEQRDGECWITTYKTDDLNPYPRISVDGKPVRIMRIAWEAHNAEPLPQGTELRHTCDNKACVNPEHLVPGTHAENMADMRGKMNNNCGRQRLTEDDYKAIAESDKPTRELADKYGVSTSHIRRICRTGSGKQPNAA